MGDVSGFHQRSCLLKYVEGTLQLVQGDFPVLVYKLNPKKVIALSVPITKDVVYVECKNDKIVLVFFFSTMGSATHDVKPNVVRRPLNLVKPSMCTLLEPLNSLPQ